MKNKIRVAILTTIAIIAVYSIPSTTTYERAENVEEPEPEILATSTEVVIEPVKKVELYPQLKRICSCESTGRPDREPNHYEADGVTVRYGRINPLDTGMCQINLHYHEATAVKMGLDLFKEEDNIRYANYLYEKEGTTPWNWSSQCWTQ